MRAGALPWRGPRRAVERDQTMNAPCAPPPGCPPTYYYPPYPPFPSNPAIGERFGTWVWNGSQWVMAPLTPITVNVQVFKASGTYTPSPGLAYATVECLGGGGGGAGVYLPTAAYAGCGGGGGAGGYSKVTLAGALVASGVAVTIGQGGAMSEIAGQAPGGTATSFGSFCVANGGNGGISATTTTWGAGGGGGAAGVGDIAMPGNSGESGYLLTNITAGNIGIEGGAGASSFYGGGVRGGGNFGTTDPGISAGANTGAGGSGAFQNWVAVSTATPGGAGGSGLCVVTEFCYLATAGSGATAQTGQAYPAAAPTAYPPGCTPWDQC